jgi:hypothetical protein
MNEYDSEIAHPGNGINTSQTAALRPNLKFHPMARDTRRLLCPGAACDKYRSHQRAAAGVRAQ